MTWAGALEWAEGLVKPKDLFYGGLLWEISWLSMMRAYLYYSRLIRFSKDLGDKFS